MNKLILFLAAAILISCGDNKKEESSDIQIGTQERTETPAATEAPSDDSVTTVTITGNDQMKFNKDEIRVKSGQKIRLTLRHVGTMDINVMGHNWVLLAQGADVAAIGQAAVEAADNDYIPADMEDQIIVHTKMLGGGGSDTIEFEAPAPGTYTFMCTFPGHYALMQGKFIVE